MNTVVAGGAGFIGSHLCDALLARGDRVICVDNLLTGSLDNLQHMRDASRFTFSNHDIINPLWIQDRIDRIYNLACPASPQQYQANPVRTIKANTLGVINLLGLAKHHGARILQASTSEVYGDPEMHPQTESYRGSVNAIGPRACYDEGKRVAESLCFDYHRQHGLDIRVARIFNTYGPRMAEDDGRVVSNFITQALSGEDLTIYGDGSQTRSFCYVSDLVAGLIALMDGDITGPVNLGNPEEYPIQELASIIIAMSGAQSRIVHHALPQDDPRKRKPDITLAKERLGWKPRVSLREGLQQTIAYFSSNLLRKRQ